MHVFAISFVVKLTDFQFFGKGKNNLLAIDGYYPVINYVLNPVTLIFYYDC